MIERESRPLRPRPAAAICSVRIDNGGTVELFPILLDIMLCAPASAIAPRERRSTPPKLVRCPTPTTRVTPSTTAGSGLSYDSSLEDSGPSHLLQARAHRQWNLYRRNVRMACETGPLGARRLSPALLSFLEGAAALLVLDVSRRNDSRCRRHTLPHLGSQPRHAESDACSMPRVSPSPAFPS